MLTRDRGRKLCEFSASLTYIVSSRTARGTSKTLYLKHRKTNPIAEDITSWVIKQRRQADTLLEVFSQRASVHTTESHHYRYHHQRENVIMWVCESFKVEQQPGKTCWLLHRGVGITGASNHCPTEFKVCFTVESLIWHCYWGHKHSMTGHRP